MNNIMRGMAIIAILCFAISISTLVQAGVAPKARSVQDVRMPVAAPQRSPARVSPVESVGGASLQLRQRLRSPTLPETVSRESYYSISPLILVPTSPTTSYTKTVGYLTSASSSSGNFQTPVSLPDGAQVTELAASLLDGSNLPGDYIEVGLYRQNKSTLLMERISHKDTSIFDQGNCGEFSEFSTAAFDVPGRENIDNNTYNYLIDVSILTSGGLDPSAHTLRVGPIKITYRADFPQTPQALQTLQFAISPTDLVPKDQNAAYGYDDGKLKLIQAEDEIFYGSVNIPHGARITHLSANCYDNDGSQATFIEVYLYRQNNSDANSAIIASLDSLAMIHDVSFHEVSVTTPSQLSVVDNDTYSYLVRATLYGHVTSNFNSENLRLGTIEITYQE